MVDATQVQRRRGTAAQCDAMIPAEGEIVVDMTNDRLRVGDGLRNGGFAVPNFLDEQNNTMKYAVAGGSANAITLTLAPAAPAYVEGMSVFFRASATNTAATTLNINGLGAVTIQKVSNGAIGGLSAGDIISGGIYQVIYNGSTFQLFSSVLGQQSTYGIIQKKSASGDATIDFALPTGYTSYELIANKVIPSSDNVALRARASVDGGSSYLTSNRYAFSFQKTGPTTSGTDAGAPTTSDFTNANFNSAFGLYGDTSTFNSGIGNNAEGVSFKIEIFADADGKNFFDWRGVAVDGTTNKRVSIFKGQGVATENSSRVNYFNMFFHSGNIASGEFTLYGRRES